MQPRSEPLLWLQCLALGAIPLALLLIRLVLAGADPGPVPGVERFLIWGVGVLAPAVALWRRPADWGSLLLVRQPLASRSSDQLRISASHGGLSSRVAVVMAAVILLPVLWWLDDSAVLASEFSPVSGQSRLVTLLLVSPLLALIVWQVQQMVQAAALLLGSTAPVAPTDASFRADAVATQRTSLGLQLLNLPGLEWPQPAVKPNNQGADEAIPVEDTEPEPNDIPLETKPENISSTNGSDDEEPEDEGSAVDPVTTGQSYDSEQTASTSDQDADETIAAAPTEWRTDVSSDESDLEESEDEASDINPPTAEESDETEPEASLEPIEPQAQVEEPEDIGANDVDESSVAAAASGPVEPEQSGEEQESTALDTEISEIDSVTGGSTEGHREQAEASGSEQSEPDEPSEPTPGGL